MNTNAELISEVLASLGDPAQEWLSPRDVARVLRNRRAFALTRLNQSDQNHNESKYEFTASGREQSLTAIGNGIPDWVERVARNDGGSSDTSAWEYVPTVNLDSLEDWRNEGRFACAFYRDGAGIARIRLTNTASEWGYFADDARYRIWYAPDMMQMVLEQGTGLPPNFNFYLTDGTIVDSIGLLMNNVAKFANTNENLISELQLAAWKELQRGAAERLAGWTEAFNEHKNRSIGGVRGRMRRPVLRGRIDW